MRKKQKPRKRPSRRADQRPRVQAGWLRFLYAAGRACHGLLVKRRPSGHPQRTGSELPVAPRGPLWYWAPVLACLVVIFYLSANRAPWDMGPVSLSDKGGHIAAYGVLGLLLVRAFGGTRGYGAASAAACAVLAATAYGILNEIHQLFVANRHATPADALANAIGAALGSALFLVAPLLVGVWRNTAARRASHGGRGRGKATRSGRRGQAGERSGARTAGARRPRRR